MVAELKKELADVKQKLADMDDMLLLAHKVCWNLTRTYKSFSQHEACKLLPKFRSAIGTERAEQIEREWRGVTAKPLMTKTE